MVKFWFFDDVVETTDDVETVRKYMFEDGYIEYIEWGFIEDKENMQSQNVINGNEA